MLPWPVIYVEQTAGTASRKILRVFAFDFMQFHVINMVKYFSNWRFKIGVLKYGVMP